MMSGSDLRFYDLKIMWPSCAAALIYRVLLNAGSLLFYRNVLPPSTYQFGDHKGTGICGTMAEHWRCLDSQG
jgi:hypothetical protein